MLDLLIHSAHPNTLLHPRSFTQDCSENDPYAGYSGAFQCMSERFGDVAFVKHTTPDDEGLTDKEKVSVLRVSALC